MAQASIALLLVLLCLHLLLNTKLAESSTTYIVGDEKGWSESVSTWPDGYTFYAGDVLEFKYLKQARTVLELTAYSDYVACTAISYTNFYVSGDDYVVLKRGTTYFIDGVPGHCRNGAKMAITAY